MTITDPNKEQIIEELQSLAKRTGKQSIALADFTRETGISPWYVDKYFDSYNDLVSQAGLQPTDVSRISDDVLFTAMRDAFLQAKGVTTKGKFRRLAEYSTSVYSRRWGGWQSILFEFRNWLQRRSEQFPYLDQLPSMPFSDEPEPESAPTASNAKDAVWSSAGNQVYGPLLNFRGLQHAPTNEQGVVFLFGMLAFEIGFIVESVATGYPDCQAKRRVSRNPDRWERVRIEFEYLSRNFRDQGHDPSKCDLIVCWEDNWPDCPIEVLDLKSTIESLEQ
jgi:hypothetical protein